MACEIVNRIEGENDIRIGTLIMDDDSTTVSRIRSELDHEVVKLSDTVSNASTSCLERECRGMTHDRKIYIDICVTTY